MEVDSLSEFGARRLAAKIRTWWFERGYTVAVQAERFVIPTQRHLKGEGIWIVRSDLGMELPKTLGVRA